MARATELLRQWCEARTSAGLAGAKVEVQELPGRTPLLLIDVPPAGSGRPGDTVLLYGHLDKQPPFTGWREGLGPWEPVIEDDRLYGRGGADDGYSTFSALTALEAVRAAGGSHSRAIVLIEASEESGGPDLPAQLDALGDRLGSPSLVIALDSWCGDWDRLWTTTSLRGLFDMVLEVEVLTEGVHSGMAGGVVPSSFRILRELIGRIEDVHTGHLIPASCTSTSPTSGCARSPRPPTSWATSPTGTRSRARPNRCGPPPSNSSSPAPGNRRSRSWASAARPCLRKPATCCGPGPR